MTNSGHESNGSNKSIDEEQNHDPQGIGGESETDKFPPELVKTRHFAYVFFIVTILLGIGTIVVFAVGIIALSGDNTSDDVSFSLPITMEFVNPDTSDVDAARTIVSRRIEMKIGESGKGARLIVPWMKYLLPLVMSTIIAFLLYRVFREVRIGNPFNRKNITMLRYIGWLIIAAVVLENALDWWGGYLYINRFIIDGAVFRIKEQIQWHVVWVGFSMEAVAAIFTYGRRLELRREERGVS